MYRHIIVVIDIPQLPSVRLVCLFLLVSLPQSNENDPLHLDLAILLSEQALLLSVLLMCLSTLMPLSLDPAMLDFHGRSLCNRDSWISL